MRFFCKHDWVMIIKTVSPPVKLTSLGGCSEYLTERLIWGVTTVLLKCKNCPYTKKEEMLGVDT